MSRRSDGQTVRLDRTLVVHSDTFLTTAYSSLRVFCDNGRAGDEEQIVLRAAESAPNQ
jgi:hypothetical protein